MTASGKLVLNLANLAALLAPSIFTRYDDVVSKHSFLVGLVFSCRKWKYWLEQTRVYGVHSYHRATHVQRGRGRDEDERLARSRALNIYAVPVNPASSQLWLAEIFLVLFEIRFSSIVCFIKIMSIF